MKIGIWKINPFVGGTETSLIELARFLKQKLNYDVFLFGDPETASKGLLNEFGLEVLPIETFPSHSKELDVVLVYDVMIPEAYWDWLKQVPIRVQVTGGFVAGGFAHTGSWITHVLAKSTDIASFARQYIEPEIPIFVSQFPINLEYWKPQKSVLKLKKGAGIPEKDFVLGSIGRIGKWKGLERIIDFKNEMNIKSLSFLIVGGVQIPDKAEVECLIDLKKEKKVFVQPIVSPVKDWYSIIDVFVMQSVQEGVSRGLMEAMAMARACVVLDVGGTHELNPKFMFAPFCEAEWIDTLERFIHFPAFRSKAGKINRAKIEAYNRFCEKRLTGFFEGLKKR